MSEINFLPMSFRRAESRRRWRTRQVAAILLAGLSLLAWWCIQTDITRRTQAHAEALTAAAAAAEDQQGELVRLRHEHEVLMHQVEIRRELQMPVPHSQILTKLSDLLPEGVGLMKLKLVTQRPIPMTRDEYDRLKDKPEKLREREKAIRLQARADQLLIEFEAFAPDDTTIANVVASLSDSPLFHDVKMHYSRQAEHRDWVGRRFRVSAVVALDRCYVPAAIAEVRPEVSDVAR